MNVQMLKLIIWPLQKGVAPRIVEFKLGKVNVITGASRTGKSAIIPIIDYCLGAGDCYVPIDTIRDHASWYGVVIQVESEQILISRRVPRGTNVSNDFYMQRGNLVSIPPYIEQANEKIEGIKQILNSISSVPYFGLNGLDDTKPYQARLGFRDLMALVFQSQDIVANQNIIFYKTHAHEHRERLRNWFPYILGAENIEVLLARQKIQEIDKKLNQLKREFQKTKSISSSWMSNMLAHLKMAKEYGVTKEEFSDLTSPEELILIAKEIFNSTPEYSKTTFDDIKSSNSDIRKLEEEDEKLALEVGALKKRLNDVFRLKSSLNEYGSSVKKRSERLSISKWLSSLEFHAKECPSCGSTEYPNSNFELNKISKVLERYENECNTYSSIPNSFTREEESLKRELELLLEHKRAIQKQINILMEKDQSERERFQQKRNLFIFLGHLKASLETFESLNDGGEFQLEIEKFEKEKENLSKIVNPKEVAKKTDVAVGLISQGILNNLQTLDVEEKYKKAAPQFKIKDLNISVLSDDGHWHYLAEVGSASNWVSFHVALMCSLQEYFLIQDNSCVPNFVIFDQPSQVYFPKLKKNSKPGDDPSYLDEDVWAVKGIFSTISSSVIRSNGKWQSIILDHADDSIYGKIEGVHEVEVWRNGNKLIPTDWYE